MRKIRPLLVGCFLLLLAVVGTGNAPALAQDREADYDRIVATYEVQPDGSVRVTEEQTVDFRGGPFTQGYARLATRGATAIRVTEVGERDPGQLYRPGREAPYTYAVTEDGDAVEVRWWFPATTEAKRHFVITYVLDGALRFYDGGDQLWWKAIRADQPDTREAVVTVALPSTVPGITLAEGHWLPADRVLPLDQVDARTARLKVSDVPSGDEIEVRVQWPHGLVRGTPSPFQQDLDVERRGEQAQIAARRDPGAALLGVAVGLISLLVLLGGAFGLYILWYRRGRDAPITLPTDYLAEPPSDLAPGLVGTLLDERADLKDVLATFVDLCGRGEANMREIVGEGFLGLPGPRDFTFRRTPTGADLAAFETAVLEAIFERHDTRELSDLKEKFYIRLPGLQQALYAGVAAAGLFEQDPDAVRRRYRTLSAIAAAVAGLLLCGTLVLTAISPAVVVLPVVMLVLSFGALVLSQFMPRKTVAGAEAAARWRAFRNYLRDIEKYRDLQAAKEVFERYLPYAIAFGLNDEWIRKFAATGAEGPPWFEPDPTYGRGWPGGGSVWLPGGGSAGGGGGGVPDLQRSSEGLGRSLQSMSVGLSAMLNSAATVMVSQPAPKADAGGGWSGGGWSGGGFSGGGGGGGGGGGFG